MILASVDGSLAGVGGWSADGEILLNYVSPTFRFAGVSAYMLAHMESALREQGLSQGKLTSTQTAHHFYLGSGWLDDGEPLDEAGMVGFPMTKILTPKPSRP